MIFAYLCGKLKEMKKILIFIIILLAISFTGEYSLPYSFSHRQIGEYMVSYTEKDSLYKQYGIYKIIFKRYNYQYHDSTYLGGRQIDALHGWNCFKNEYGDTVCVIYTDYTKYPRREE